MSCSVVLCFNLLRQALSLSPKPAGWPIQNLQHLLYLSLPSNTGVADK